MKKSQILWLLKTLMLHGRPLNLLKQIRGLFIAHARRTVTNCKARMLAPRERFPRFETLPPSVSHVGGTNSRRTNCTGIRLFDRLDTFAPTDGCHAQLSRM